MPASEDVEINWEASQAAKHVALEILAQMVVAEYPSGYSLAEIVECWGPLGLAEADLAAVREVFPP